MKHSMTVHMIGSAHIDPVWLWRWQAGVVEVLSTCRTAVELLEKHPDFIFTRSDVWVHEIVEKYEPELFKRIQLLASAGRWYPAGGWYVQPDSNLPIAESYQRHIDMGRKYFTEKLGITVDVGFNVDSFGHNASLPDILVENGYDSYVMMRPMAVEKELPADLFRWKGAGGAEVAVWRIQNSYNASTIETLEVNIEAAVSAAPAVVSDVMCFYGVGDHGGGPTEELISWIENHASYRPGVELQFSHPRRFFDTIKRSIPDLPLVHDELQMHAIGCYTVVAEMKRSVRRAEYALLQAERAQELAQELARPNTGSRLTDQRRDIEDAWKTTLFNQFHDTLGGSSIEEAYTDARDQLGHACAIADRITADLCFEKLTALEPAPLQQIAAFWFGNDEYTGPIVHEPWLHPNGFSESFNGALLDKDDNEIDYQIVQQSAILGPPRAMLFEGAIKPNAPRLYRLDSARRATTVETDLEIAGTGVGNSRCSIEPGEHGETVIVRASSVVLPDGGLPGDLYSLAVIDDPSDTWSHRIDGYRGEQRGRFEVVESAIEETGPIRSTIRVTAHFGTSRMNARFHLYRKSSIIDIDMEVLWTERSAILKLVIPDTSLGNRRLDGIPIGALSRDQNGKEYPFLDWTLLDSGLGIISGDCFGFDGIPGFARFTLVRSPVYAWHDPTELREPEAYRYTDQGVHRYNIRIIPDADQRQLEENAEYLHHKPIVHDWTNGMTSE